MASNANHTKSKGRSPELLSTAKMFLSTAVFLAVFLWALIEVVSPEFAYLGFYRADPTMSQIATAIIATLVSALIVPKRWNKISDSAQTVLLFFVTVPAIWVPVFMGDFTESVIRTAQLAAVCGVVAIRVATVGRLRLTVAGLGSQRSTNRLLFVSAVCGISFLMIAYGLRPAATDLLDVYDTREEYATAIGTAGTYIVGALVNAVLALALANGLHRRKFWYILTASSGYILIFSLTGHKSFYIAVPLALLTYAIAHSRSRGAYLWPLAFSCVIALAVLSDRLTSSIAATSIVVRRGLATGGMNTSYYISYFAEREKYELRHSLLSFTGNHPYSDTPRMIVGYAFYNPPVAANVSYIGDGYANLGLVGCVVAAAAVGVYLRLVDLVSSGLPLPLGVAGTAAIMVPLTNSAPLTAMLTHGGIVLLVFLFLNHRTEQLGKSTVSASSTKRSRVR